MLVIVTRSTCKKNPERVRTYVTLCRLSVDMPFDSIGLYIRSMSIDFPLVVLQIISIILVPICLDGACLEVVLEFE